jgi:predicted nuclease with TOPRIM domain
MAIRLDGLDAAERITPMNIHDINYIGGLQEENARLKAEVERLTKQNALATPRHLIASQDIKTLREQIEELKLENSQYEEHHKYGQNVITSLREEVERLTKAVMHSPAAQLKLKELEGKTTFDEINPKNSNGF